MIQTETYDRKPFTVQAIQVTLENIAEVAELCNGEVMVESGGDQFIKVDVHNPMNDKQTQAHVTDWVLDSGRGYKVYTNKAFRAGFQKGSGAQVTVVANVFDGANTIKPGGGVHSSAALNTIPGAGGGGTSIHHAL